jgi:hypothetical protein
MLVVSMFDAFVMAGFAKAQFLFQTWAMVINDDKTDGKNPSSINEYWLSE